MIIFLGIFDMVGSNGKPVNLASSVVTGKKKVYVTRLSTNGNQFIWRRLSYQVKKGLCDTLITMYNSIYIM